MDTRNCTSLKASLVTYFGQRVEVDTLEDKCVISLPLLTIDDRYLMVFVEPKMNDYYFVHDGGKTAAELFSQGIHITDKKADVFRTMAHRMGIGFGDEKFSVGCKAGEIQ